MRLRRQAAMSATTAGKLWSASRKTRSSEASWNHAAASRLGIGKNATRGRKGSRRFATSPRVPSPMKMSEIANISNRICFSLCLSRRCLKQSENVKTKGLERKFKLEYTRHDGEKKLARKDTKRIDSTSTPGWLACKTPIAQRSSRGSSDPGEARTSRYEAPGGWRSRRRRRHAIGAAMRRCRKSWLSGAQHGIDR